MKALRHVPVCVATGLFSATARACTVCDSQNGHALRAGLFNGHFLHTSLLIAAPIPVFMAVVALVYLGMPDLQTAEAPACELGTLDPEPAA